MAVDEVSPDALQAISIPDKVETNFGNLQFFDGVPTKATADILYDNLDRMRAVMTPRPARNCKPARHSPPWAASPRG